MRERGSPVVSLVLAYFLGAAVIATTPGSWHGVAWRGTFVLRADPREFEQDFFCLALTLTAALLGLWCTRTRYSYYYYLAHTAVANSAHQLSAVHARRPTLALQCNTALPSI